MANGTMKRPAQPGLYSLLLGRNINGDSETVSTYNGRKISNYNLLIFILRYNLNDALMRDSMIVEQSSFGIVTLAAHHGDGLRYLSTMTVAKTSDTSFTVTKGGEKGLNSIEILGVKLV